MSTNVIQSSLSAGEVSPSIFARVDLNQYKLGLATCRNWFVDYRSGVSTRPGTQFVARCKVSNTLVRLIPFQFSDTSTFMIEVGPQYFRFLQNGGQILFETSNINGITFGSPITFQMPAGFLFQNGDTVVPTGTGIAFLDNNSFLVVNTTSNSFQITDLDGTMISIASGVFTGGTASVVYTLGTPYLAQDIQLLKYTQNGNVMTITHPSYQPMTLTRLGPANWVLAQIQFSTPINPPATLTLSTSGAGPPTATFSYVVTAVDANGNESQPTLPATITGVNISATAGTNTLTWTPVPGAVAYNIYKAELSTASSPPTGASFGFIGTAGGIQAQDSNILPDFTVTPPKHLNPFAPGAITQVTVLTAGTGGSAASTMTVTDIDGSGATFTLLTNAGGMAGAIITNGGQNYSNPTPAFTGFTANPTVRFTIGPKVGTFPGCSDFYQQRQVYGNTNNQPQTFWMSQPGSYNNFDVSDPVTASDSISGTIVSKQLNSIKHMIPMPGGLVVLTSQGAWQVSGGGGGINNPVPITPADAQAVPQAYIGASDVQPLVVNYDILYIQARGSVVRDLSYNLYFNIYAGTDISVFSNHLFFGHQIVQWAYAQEPYKIIWAIRDDGILLSLTFLKEQQLQGWARHDTYGLFVSVATIVESSTLPSNDITFQDSTYFIIQRPILTSTGPKTLQYIERLQERIFTYGAEDAQSLDCAIESPRTAPQATITSTAAGPPGTTVTIKSSANVFNSGQVGWVIRLGGGVLQITAFVSPTQVQATITSVIQPGFCFPISPIFNGPPNTFTLPNDPLRIQYSNVPFPAVAGTWTLNQPFTVWGGLGYLSGNQVMVVADGNVVGPLTIVNGAITLPVAATKVQIGLPFTCDLQTLRLDVGENAAQGGTVQGKRKLISAVTLRLKDTRGLQAGRTFGTLVPIKEGLPQLGGPISLVTGDERINLDPLWNSEGQICIRQQWPMPATVLGIIPEVTIGDTPSK